MTHSGEFLCILPLHIDLFCTPKGLKRVGLSSPVSDSIDLQAKTTFFTYTFHGNYWKKEIVDWLKCYAERISKLPDFPFDDEDLSPFQKRVLREICAIPFGSTCSYGEIANALGGTHLARAVGSACRTNPWPLFLGCHRVISSSGSLGGYAYGLPMKQMLLKFEKANAF